MSHRTQITLTDAQYARLKQESERTGIGLAGLIRRALGMTYGPRDSSSARQILEESFGAWADRETDGKLYVEHIRRGTARRLDQ